MAIHRLLRLIVLVAVLCPSPARLMAEEGWTTSQENGIRYVRYSATAPLAAPTPFRVSFHSDTTETPELHGVIGFELSLKGVARLAPFSFTDFEGPDATTGGSKLLAVKVVRKGQPALSFELSPSGSTPAENEFEFGVTELTREPQSEPKSILKALRDGSESMEITITDPKNPKLKLAFSIPVAGQEARFRDLLTGVK